MAEIRVVSGPLKGDVFDVSLGITTIGREQTNTIQVNDFEMSRRHAELHLRVDECLLVDLGSSNGTTVNGNRVSTCALNPGDRFVVGQTTFEFVSNENDGSVASNSTGDTVGNDDDDSRDEPAVAGNQSQGSNFDSTEQLLKTKSNVDVLYNAALASGSYHSTENLLQRILELVFYWISADRACILIREDDQDTIYAKSVNPDAEELYSNQPFDIQYSVIKHVFRKQEGVVVNDISNDKRFSNAYIDNDSDDRQLICAPIHSRNGVLGVIYADKPRVDSDGDGEPNENYFDDQQLKLLIAIGLHAAVSIENAEYYSNMLQAERVTAVGNAMASLSHHIKNVLQSINGGNHLIEQGLSGNQLELIRNGWQIVEHNQDSLSNLLLDMLTYSRSIVPMLCETDLNQLVRKSVEAVSRQAKNAQVDIVYKESTEFPTMQFEPELLSRAVKNVLLASIDSCRENSGGVVNVKLFRDEDGNGTTIEISDNGISRTSTELNSIFDPFLNGEKSSRVGLGMAVAQKIVKEFGGETFAELNEQQGAKYRLHFPVETKNVENDFKKDLGNRASNLN